MSSFEKLGNFLQINKEKETQESQILNDNSIAHKPETISYSKWGFKQAGKLEGETTGLLACLAIVSDDFIHNFTRNTKKIEKDVQKALKSKNQLEEKKEHTIQKMKTEENIVSEIKEKITNLKTDINNIRKHPEYIIKDKASKVSFIIGLLILIALTIYLFVFYSSASYSAFFKQFTLTKLGIASSIFDPEAMKNAFKDGITELILIISMPFVFIGLGFLIHKFQEQKGFGKYLKITLLILVTFIFDAILAFEITSKIYNIIASNSFHDMPPYTLKMAFESVNFWLIIFAGFIVYIIWGFVFDFTMETYDKLDIVKQAIRANEKDIIEFEKELKEKNDNVESFKNEISELNIKIFDADQIINGDKIHINLDKFTKMTGECFDGWLKFIVGAGFSKQNIEEATDKMNEFVTVYKNKYKSQTT